MAKPLYLQYQNMEGPIDWPDFQVLIAWARKEGYDGTQAVVRENSNKPWGPDNCKLKADGARPKAAGKGGKAKTKAKAKAEPEVTDQVSADGPTDDDDEPDKPEPTAEGIANLLG